LRRRVDHKGPAEEAPATAPAPDSGDPEQAFDAANGPLSIASATRPPDARLLALTRILARAAARDRYERHKKGK
jgi:hypothetical protein